MTTVVLTPSSTSPWVAPAGVSSVEVQCWGAGGNAGASQSGGRSGGGGGGGEFAQETSVAVTPGNSYSFTCPAGGSASATTFTGDSLTVTAHPGGSGSSSSTSPGAGGTGSTNSIHYNGGAGGSGQTGTSKGAGGGGSSAGTGSAGAAGGGGSGAAGGSGGTAPSGGGNGGNGAGSAGTGNAGTAPGGGAGGPGSGVTNSGASGGAAQIILTYTASTTISGTATLTGSGTLTGTGVFAASGTLSGSGSLANTGPLINQGAALTGSGTLSGAVIGTIQETITLSGAGTLTGTQTGTDPGSAALTGSGSLSPAVTFKYPAALSGTGTLSIVGTGGTVAASAGASTPYAFPGTSQVSVAPQGSSDWQYLGSLGAVTALKYSFACPGGCDQMTCTVMVPADYRTQLFNPGWQVRVTRGGHVVWTGVLDEPVPTASGWNLTAVGTGNLGQNYVAVYTDTWPSGEPDEAVNGAISRGLPWVNPGIGSPSGIWLGQGVDSGAQTITALLNLACTRGGLTWYVNSQPGGYPGADLSVFPLPTVVNRLLVCTQPVARTLGGDINSIWIKYEITAASSSTSGSQTATYGTVNVQNAASVAAHGVLETYIDLSSAGVMTSAAAEQVGQNVLSVYKRASFGGPFVVNYGQLLNVGGVPIDIGADQAGNVAQLILTDFGYGGEVEPGPISFIIGSYSYDDFAQAATITPYQALDQSLTGLLSMENTVLTPITTQS
jgi:hypothetical protein